MIFSRTCRNEGRGQKIPRVDTIVTIWATLLRAGDTTFYYNEHGALRERCDCLGVTRYAYGNDTMPDTVVAQFAVILRQVSFFAGVMYERVHSPGEKCTFLV